MRLRWEFFIMKRFTLSIDNEALVTYLEQRAKKQTFNTRKKVTRNEVINQILQNEMIKDLTNNREVDMLKDSLDDFKHILQQYIDTNNALLYRAFEADGI